MFNKDQRRIKVMEQYSKNLHMYKFGLIYHSYKYVIFQRNWTSVFFSFRIQYYILYLIMEPAGLNKYRFPLLVNSQFTCSESPLHTKTEGM